MSLNIRNYKVYLLLGVLFASSLLFAQDDTPTQNDSSHEISQVGDNSSLQRALREFLKIDKMKITPLTAYSVEPDSSTGTQFITLRFKSRNDIPAIRLRMGTGNKIESRLDDGVLEILIPRSEPSQWNFKPALISHPLHPYIKHDFFPYIPRETQIEAIGAFRVWLESEKKTFNYVSPTGTGKTSLLEDGIRMGIQKGEKVFVVITDSVDLVAQNGDFLKKQFGSEVLVETFYFGNPLQIENFEPSSKPKILICSAAQFRKIRGFEMNIEEAAVREHSEEEATPDKKSLDNAAEIGKKVSYIFYDEGHHSSAPIAGVLIDAMIGSEGSHARFINMSAVPLHADGDVPTRFAKYGATTFYAYLNSSSDFRATEAQTLVLEHLFEQLAMAIKAGDVQPFGAMNLMNANSLGLSAQQASQFYTKVDGSFNFSINPDFYPQVLKFLAVPLREGKRGLIVASTIEEAERITKELQKKFSDLRFASYHSSVEKFAKFEGDERLYKTKEAALDAMKSGSVDYLVIVDSLREGMNLPGISHIVDLGRVTTPGAFLNTIGRASRLEVGKDPTQITAAYALDSDSVLLNMDFYYRLSEFLDDPHVWTSESTHREKAMAAKRVASLQISEAIDIAESWQQSRGFLLAGDAHEDDFVSLDHRGNHAEWIHREMDALLNSGEADEDVMDLRWHNSRFKEVSLRELYADERELMLALSEAVKLLSPRETLIFGYFAEGKKLREISPLVGQVKNPTEPTSPSQLGFELKVIKARLRFLLINSSTKLLGQEKKPEELILRLPFQKTDSWKQYWEVKMAELLRPGVGLRPVKNRTTPARNYLNASFMQEFMESTFKECMARTATVDDVVKWTRSAIFIFFPNSSSSNHFVPMSIVSMLGDNPESVLFSKLNADQKRIIATNLFASIFGPFEGREDGPALKHFAVFEKEAYQKKHTRNDNRVGSEAQHHSLCKEKLIPVEPPPLSSR